MTSNLVSVRPRLRAMAPVAVLPAAAVLRAFVNGGAFEWWVSSSGCALFLAALGVVRFGCAVTVTADTVTVRRQLRRTVSFGLDRLRSVSGGPPPGKEHGVEALRFEGIDATRASFSMEFVSQADRRRLVAVLTERTAPDVVRWDAPMRAMLTETPDTPPGSGLHEAAGPRSEG